MLYYPNIGKFLGLSNNIITFKSGIFDLMKDLKDKTQPEKELERIKSKPMSKELKASIDKKLSYVNRDIKK